MTLNSVTKIPSWQSCVTKWGQLTRQPCFRDFEAKTGPSGGPYAALKACERTVSQGDQEQGPRHHGTRYPDNHALLGQAAHYPYPLLFMSYRNSQTHAECHTKTYILADKTWSGQGDKEVIDPLHMPLFIPYLCSVTKTQASSRHGFQKASPASHTSFPAQQVKASGFVHKSHPL